MKTDSQTFKNDKSQLLVRLFEGGLSASDWQTLIRLRAGLTGFTLYKRRIKDWLVLIKPLLFTLIRPNQRQDCLWIMPSSQAETKTFPISITPPVFASLTHTTSTPPTTNLPPKQKHTPVKLTDASLRDSTVMSSYPWKKENLKAQEQVLLEKQQPSSCPGSRALLQSRQQGSAGDASKESSVQGVLLAQRAWVRQIKLGLCFNKLANILPIWLWYAYVNS